MTRTGYPCPACGGPTRVTRTARRSIGLARTRLCRACGLITHTREVEEEGAHMRRNVEMLIRETQSPLILTHQRVLSQEEHHEPDTDPDSR